MQDLKPRNKKAPLDLIPWDVLRGLMGSPTIDLLGEMGGVLPDRFTIKELLLSLLFLPPSVIEGGHRALLEGAARVFEYGNKKYAFENWKSSDWEESDRRTYFAAICRHIVAYDSGESVDPESGIHHLYHALAGALIYAWHELDND